MSVKLAGIEFDRVVYDGKGDVLYLHVGDPASGADWDESAEGDGVVYGSDGSLIGLTILNARRRVEREGKIVVTLPSLRIEADELAAVLAPV